MAQLFTTFNFKVLLHLPNQKDLCEAAFSECSGLEMNMAPKTIREGGNNGRQIHLAGPVSFGQLSLKRGMTSSFDLWEWFDKVQQQRNLRASGEIHLLSPSREKTVIFKLSGCLPVKLRAPTLSAKDGQIAIEEMQIAYEHLRILKPNR
ncbi:phage tail protein [uncultured Desulfobacter sp.]|uniref:phage tail protein n=1 Tax=uncultured Desulfobacter sp. TaxID=240139 RepID=UPI0029F50814|nr:phage tail protein [uncultured Desulfobacter sp.]